VVEGWYVGCTRVETSEHQRVVNNDRSSLYVLVWQGMTGWCSARFAHLRSQSHSVLILIHPHQVGGPIQKEFGIHMMMMIATEATSSSQEFVQNSAKFPFDFPWYSTSNIKQRSMPILGTRGNISSAYQTNHLLQRYANIPFGCPASQRLHGQPNGSPSAPSGMLSQTEDSIVMQSFPANPSIMGSRIQQRANVKPSLVTTRYRSRADSLLGQPSSCEEMLPAGDELLSCVRMHIV